MINLNISDEPSFYWRAQNLYQHEETKRSYKRLFCLQNLSLLTQFKPPKYKYICGCLQYFSSILVVNLFGSTNNKQSRKINNFFFEVHHRHKFGYVRLIQY